MDSIDEMLLLSGAVITLTVILAYTLPNINSFSGMYKGQAIATVILNSFKLGSPISSSGQAIIYDNGYPTTLYVSITPYNSTSGVPLSNADSFPKSFVLGPNQIQLPFVSGNVYYKISLYSSDGSILYKTFYVSQYATNYAMISNLFGYVKTYLDGALINLQQTNSTSYLYLPDGSYSLNIYSPYYFYKYNFGFPQNKTENIILPTSSNFVQYAIPVYQMLPGKNLQHLPGAVISLNNNTATYKANSGGIARISYTNNASVEISVTCPANLCGTGITNNYTSFYGVSDISTFQNGTTTPIILYPLYRTIFNEQILCNGTTYPTPGTITIIANPPNATMNRYGLVNASGQFITYLAADNYNITASTLSGLFNKTSVNIIKQNQTFNINITYCVVHVPTNSIIFEETGLPSNTLWNVTYGSVLNQSSTNKISFNVLQNENYTYTIPNVTNKTTKIIYFPNKPSGASYPGTIIYVTFKPNIVYVPINITNSQTVATPAPFQQMIQFSPSSYTQYENSNLGNIRFFKGSTELYSWCESGCSSTASQATFWVKLPNGVPASNTITVNMTFEPTSTNYDGVYAGEAPQLSSTYGQYDDGASVFNFYDNFAGTSLNTNLWVNNVANAGGTLTINNGMSFTGGGDNFDPFIYSVNTFSQGVFEEYGSVPPSTDANWNWAGFGLSSSSNVNYNCAIEGIINSGDTELITGTNSGTDNFVSGLSTGTHIWQIFIPSSSPTTIYGSQDYGTLISSSTDMPTLSQPLVFYQMAGVVGSTTSTWVRARAYPPNGVMPSTSFGSVK
jgi:hypothetical protein